MPLCQSARTEGFRREREEDETDEELRSVFLSLLLKSRGDRLVSTFWSSVGAVVVVYQHVKDASVLEICASTSGLNVELTFEPVPSQRRLLQRRAQTNLHRPGQTNRQRLLLFLQSCEEWRGRIEEGGSEGSVGRSRRKGRDSSRTNSRSQVGVELLDESWIDET